MNSTTTKTITGGAASAWPRPAAAAVAFGGTALYVLQGTAVGCANRSHKRSPMADTTIDGWPPGLSGGPS